MMKPLKYNFSNTANNVVHEFFKYSTIARENKNGLSDIFVFNKTSWKRKCHHLICFIFKKNLNEEQLAQSISGDRCERRGLFSHFISDSFLT